MNDTVAKKGDLAVVIIDMQKGFEAAAWGKRNNPGAEKAVGRALAWARAHEYPVLHVRHASRKAESPLSPGQCGFDFKAEAQPLPGEPVIVKHEHGAFVDTDLDARLRRLGVKRLVLGGLVTDHCVSTTARMGADLGYEVAILGDATATFDRYDADGELVPADLVHRVNLASLKKEFADIITTEDLTAREGLYARQ